jgi:hypothetical protein
MHDILTESGRRDCRLDHNLFAFSIRATDGLWRSVAFRPFLHDRVICPTAETAVALYHPRMERLEDAMTSLGKFGSFPAKVFADMGRDEIAYVKPVNAGTGTTWTIYAADGTYLHEFDSRETAFAALRHIDMEPLSVH